MGAGAGGFAGGAGFAAGGAAAAAATGAATTGGDAGVSAGDFASTWTEPASVAFTPPGTEGCSVDGFGTPSGGEDGDGDLMSSGIGANAQTYGSSGYGENVNFYQLEDSVSTRLH
jgi:hypothetical protein